MKTICIKTNNICAIDYLLNKLNTINIDGIKISSHLFNTYNNIFVHYKGNQIHLFMTEISNILSSLVIDIYEPLITKKIILRKSLYFDTIEQNQLFKQINNNIASLEHFSLRKLTLFNTFLDFLKYENKLFLKGFITFRLNNYVGKLSEQIESSINEFIIDKEYNDFVSLLNLYVNSEESKIESVHLIYTNKEPILLDKNNKPIECDINLTNAKFLSDITFSQADVIFNTLLNIIPKKIYIHLNNKKKDEFINTLELVFENRIYYN